MSLSASDFFEMARQSLRITVLCTLSQHVRVPLPSDLSFRRNLVWQSEYVVNCSYHIYQWPLAPWSIKAELWLRMLVFAWCCSLTL